MVEKGSEVDVAALRATLEEYVRRFNDRDFEGWLTLWSEDGVQMMPFVPAVVGVERIREVMEPIFSDYEAELMIREVQDVVVEGDTGLTRCIYSMKMMKNGRRAPGIPDGKTLTVYSRHPDGSWRVSYDCSNANSRKREYPV